MANNLRHFGVVGMKWGVHKSSPIPPSDDATRAKEAYAKVKKGGVQALSNHELQNLVARLNLEKQYDSLAPLSKTGHVVKFIADILLNVGKQQATRLAADAVTKQIGQAFKK